MANKLKDSFSKKPISTGLNFDFDSHESYKRFLEAVDEVNDKGCTLQIEGISTVKRVVKDGSKVYPLANIDHPDRVVIGPSFDIISIPITTECGVSTIELRRFLRKDGIELQTDPGSLVMLKLKFHSESHKVSLNTESHIEKAKTVKDVADSYDIIIGILKKLLRPEIQQDELEIREQYEMIRHTFRTAFLFWKKLAAIEEKFGITFLPSEIQKKEEDFWELEELYLMLIEHRAVRHNRKLTSIDSKKAEGDWTARLPKVGEELGLTLSGFATYFIGGKNLKIYTTSFVLRAKVKEIIKDGDNIKTVFYDDTDSEPMYISSTGYLTAAEADDESELIFTDKNRIEQYRNAVLPSEALKKELDEW